MSQLEEINKQIELNLDKIEIYLQNNKQMQALFLELTVNRQLQERNRLIMEDLSLKLDKMLNNDVNLKKINQKLDVLIEKKSFWQKIITSFKK
jgi:hypothetical protein